MKNRSSVIVFAIVAAAVTVGACHSESRGAQPQTDNQSIADTDSVRRNAPVDSAAIRAAVANTAAAAALDSGKAPPKGAGASASAVPPTVVHLLPGRSKKDSVSLVDEVRTGRADTLWPVKGPAPLPGSILPQRRIVAFYGNPLSKRMGVLGEYPVDTMLARFDAEIVKWQKADPSTPVQPALHLIAVVAQGDPGRDGMYRLRMTDSLINMVYGWAQKRHAILFLDVQVAGSTLQQELPRLLPFLERPDVHLGIDPEFSMHYSRQGLKPGVKIGIMDAADVNYAIQTLSKLVTDKKLPPKVLVVHRFTHQMVSHAEKIKLDPNVQVVMNMDGWGQPWLKFDSYEAYIESSPVQYTGFKLFYHNDTKKGDKLLTPEEVLQLIPRPLYIQYQ